MAGVQRQRFYVLRARGDTAGASLEVNTHRCPGLGRLAKWHLGAASYETSNDVEPTYVGFIFILDKGLSRFSLT